MNDEQRESLTHTVRAALDSYLLLPEPKVFGVGLYMQRFAEYVVHQIADQDYFQGGGRVGAVGVVSQEVIDNVKRQIEELREQEKRDFQASGHQRRSLDRLAIREQLKRGCK